MISAGPGEEEPVLEKLKFQMRVGGGSMRGSETKITRGKTVQGGLRTGRNSANSPESNSISVTGRRGHQERLGTGQSCCGKYFGLYFNNNGEFF